MKREKDKPVETVKPVYSISRFEKAASAVEKTRAANKSWADRRRDLAKSAQAKPTTNGSWRRETYRLPRDEAREQARKFLKKYPKAAYWSEVESWRVLEGDLIEFTMRRLPTAD